MSNSSLVCLTKISPFKTVGRNHVIDTITIHCTAGHMSLENFAYHFSTCGASCNYCIARDGRIGMFVEEKDRSWCSSSSSNDNRAITIEVSSSMYDPYEVSDESYSALIKLCADICQRNNIPKLLWKADKKLIGEINKQNMTAHRWFANKACPGDYLYNRFGDIAEKVNRLLAQNKPIGNNNGAPEERPIDPNAKVPFVVRVKIDCLRIRKGPATSSKNIGYIKPGAYTIVEVRKGNKNTWGKLKSGIGWISLKYTERV